MCVNSFVRLRDRPTGGSLAASPPRNDSGIARRLPMSQSLARMGRKSSFSFISDIVGGNAIGLAMASPRGESQPAEDDRRVSSRDGRNRPPRLGQDVPATLVVFAPSGLKLRLPDLRRKSAASRRWRKNVCRMATSVAADAVFGCLRCKYWQKPPSGPARFFLFRLTVNLATNDKITVTLKTGPIITDNLAWRHKLAVLFCMLLPRLTLQPET